jgi:hypothetical protein
VAACLLAPTSNDDTLTLTSIYDEATVPLQRVACFCSRTT